MEFFNGLGVVTEIHLAADENDRETLAKVQNLGDPLQIYQHVDPR